MVSGTVGLYYCCLSATDSGNRGWWCLKVAADAVRDVWLDEREQYDLPSTYYGWERANLLLATLGCNHYG